MVDGRYGWDQGVNLAAPRSPPLSYLQQLRLQKNCCLRHCIFTRSARGKAAPCVRSAAAAWHRSTLRYLCSPRWQRKNSRIAQHAAQPRVLFLRARHALRQRGIAALFMPLFSSPPARANSAYNQLALNAAWWRHNNVAAAWRKSVNEMKAAANDICAVVASAAAGKRATTAGG